MREFILFFSAFSAFLLLFASEEEQSNGTETEAAVRNNSGQSKYEKSSEVTT